jgi:transposase
LTTSRSILFAAEKSVARADARATPLTLSGSDDLRAKLEAGLAIGDVASVLSVFDALMQKHDELGQKHDALAAKLQRRELLIRHYQRVIYGRSSEKLSDDDVRQLVLLYGATEEEASVAEPRLVAREPADVEPEEQDRSGGRTKKIRHPGRTRLSTTLERIVRDAPVPANERACCHCGTEMTTLRYVEHERVEFVPAKFVVHVERREVVVCKAAGCRKDAATAERVSTPAETRVAPSVFAHLIESKCDDALPIHRQCDQFARLGFEVPVNTLYGYWAYATDLLLPVADAVFGTVLDDALCVAMDDTGIDVLDGSRATGKYRGHLWCVCGTTSLVAFRFTESWDADEIEPWIRATRPDAFIQIDDYKGYSALYEDVDGSKAPLVPPHRRLGCMMHVRRRFHEALKLGDKRAGFAVEVIRRIYEIEERARGKPPDEILKLRTEHSLPLLDSFDKWIDDLRPKLGTTGYLAEATRYASAQRPFIRRCFTDGRFAIDNGRVERAIREPAIGRKNFLFTGSAAAGARLAAAYTLVLSCRALGISTHDYLVDVITRIAAGWPARQLVELMPQNWAASRRSTAASA